MQHKRIGNSSGFVQWIVLLAVVVLAGLVMANMQAIRNYARLYNYDPPGEIIALADQTAMTDDARTMFYVNHPVLADRSTFSGQCTSRGEQTIVLGCYRPVDRGIFLFDVQDERLEGVEQVTAAHEMLHAAYDRLSSKERDSIDMQLQSFYNEQVKDERMRDTIAAYEKTEPNDVINEMHSIFATEIESLPEPLESYYKRYFTDRSKVVELASSYRHEFTTRQERVRVYDLQLMKLKDTIDGDRSALERRESDIKEYQQQLESLRGSGNIEGYNALVPIYNARVDQYNALVRTVQGNITEYNQLVADRNELALQVKELTESISSSPKPID